MTSSVHALNSIKISCRPFLKWAGGKSQLLQYLLRYIPLEYSAYYEPFVGGGALFFALQPEVAYLSDTNEDLINCYRVIRDRVDELILELSKYKYDKEQYYEVRSLDRTNQFDEISSVQKAARLIYLNKTCFNGLYRVSAKGYFNVPFGRYTNPKICDAENLKACSLALKDISLSKNNFLEIEDKLKADDFVYLDPPYVPLNTSSNFTAYSAEGFSLENQVLLRDFCLRISKTKVKFMLSNSNTEVVRELYKDFNYKEVSAKRHINSIASKRGKVSELLVTNY
jgi:DNA adenine methylase